MAKRQGRAPLRLAPLAAAAMLLAVQAQALAQTETPALAQAETPAQAPVLAKAGWRIIPTIGITETWTDNVTLQSDSALKHSDLVSQVTPGITVVNRSPRLNVSASAQWHQFAYLHGIANNTRDSQRSYSGALQSVLVQDLLYLDASASRGQRSVSAFGPQLTNDLYILGNRTEVKTWSFSPYLVQRFGNIANMQLRYSRDSVDSNLNQGFGKSDSDNVSASLASGAAFSTLGWGLNYYRQDLDSDRLGETSTENLAANLSYRLTARLALTANAGYDRYEFAGPGGRNEGRNWSGGVIWNPSARTSLQAALGRHYYGQTGSVLASHRSRYTVWNISYSDAITTSRQQFLLPSALDTTALLDRLFSTAYPDPLERERVVAAYIEATGLPPSLADNVNYLSNRYMRQKALQATAAFRRARTNAVLSLYSNHRNALSDQQSDSELLGSLLTTLNDNVRQRGLRASYTYQMNSRSNLIASWNISRSHSLTTDILDRQRVLRVGMTRRLGQQLLGKVEFRRRTGNVGTTNSSKYEEHAISASLSMQL
ncbi:TIGR03016 family PEP-CTERM system-associated outer membrane protein [Massilia niastensis]|uniref:TIGR03016 family PEP-CTERM system-associated outer membrane protein n=1 Tax=Massilia niastensis TaxID=544911 RepID=UPI00037C571D|nr:TIGR03016 family PEP-CTERM system-associated outer membrane protein [Massilia niastensis]